MNFLNFKMSDKMNDPLVCVVVPVYNVELYLRRCLDSLVSQTFKDIEIICIDDCSTDNSLSILHEYAWRDSRIKVLQHLENKGLSATRNTGISHTRTPYVMFCDGDDYYESTMVEKMIEAMEHHPDADYAVCGIDVVYECHEYMARADERYFRIKYEGETRLTDDVILQTDVSACNKIFRMDKIASYGLSFPVGLRYEDCYFYNIYSIQSKYAVFIPEKLYHYVRRDSSIMSRTFDGHADYAADHLNIAFRVYEYMNTHGLLQGYLHFFGNLFFTLFDSALRHSSTQESKERVYQQAELFLRQENLYFEEDKRLAYAVYLLFKRRQIGTVCKKMKGLLRIKQKATCVKYYFCGIYFWKSSAIKL